MKLSGFFASLVIFLHMAALAMDDRKVTLYNYKGILLVDPAGMVWQHEYKRTIPNEVPKKYPCWQKREDISNKDIISVNGNEEETLLLSKTGEVFLWEWGSEIEKVFFLDSTRIIQMEITPDIHDIGYAALAQDGTLYTWGFNEDGRLGLGHTNEQESPCAIKDLKFIRILNILPIAALTLSDDVFAAGPGITLFETKLSSSLSPVKALCGQKMRSLCHSFDKDYLAGIWGAVTESKLLLQDSNQIIHELKSDTPIARINWYYLENEARLLWISDNGDSFTLDNENKLSKRTEEVFQNIWHVSSLCYIVKRNGDVFDTGIKIDKKTIQHPDFGWSPENHKYFQTSTQERIKSFFLCMKICVKKHKLPKTPRMIMYLIIKELARQEKNTEKDETNCLVCEGGL